eukprot:3480386-Prymnesium_polylepis.1
MPQASATAGLAACELAAQSASLCESTAVAALGLPGPADARKQAHSYMSEWDFLEGKNKRIGAHVIENAELRGLRHLGLDRDPSLRVSGGPFRDELGLALEDALDGALST